MEISHVISLGISHLSCSLLEFSHHVSVVIGTCTDFTINQNLFKKNLCLTFKTILIIV